MYKYTAIFLCGLFLSGMVLSCKKYPEGKNFSMRSADYRIRGSFSIESYIVNGIDSTGFLPGSKTISFPHESGGTSPITGYNEGYWRLSRDRRWINVNAGKEQGVDPSTVKLIFAVSNIELGWRIIKLTKAELKIKTTCNGREYQLSFKKTEQG
jgi:hypothetical protein